MGSDRRLWSVLPGLNFAFSNGDRLIFSFGVRSSGLDLREYSGALRVNFLTQFCSSRRQDNNSWMFVGCFVLSKALFCKELHNIMFGGRYHSKDSLWGFVNNSIITRCDIDEENS